MDETGTTSVPRRRSWLKRIGIALGLLVLILLVLHRPILHAIVHKVAISAAAKQNLKLDFRVEGSVLGGIELRNVHAVATGPSAVQSADVDLLRVDYSLVGYLRGGLSQLLENIELRNATVILDPSKAPPTPEPKKNEKFTLPAFFPDRLTLSDVNVRMASQPNEFIIQHLNLELLPNQPGELRIAKLQLASGKSWTGVTAQTTYENRNLYLRNLVLDDQTQLATVNIDASQIGQNKLSIGLNGKVAGGQIETKLSLGGQGDSVQSNIDLSVRDTSLDAVRRYFQPEGSTPENDVVKKTAEAASKTVGAAATAVTGDKRNAETAAKADVPSGISGDVKQLTVKGTGTADQPRTWAGTIDGQINNLSAGGVTFDRANIDVKAADGHAQINQLELTRGANSIALQGTAELPETTVGFGHVPATVQLRGKLPDLGEITSGMAQPITGSAEVNGQIKVANDIVNADVAIAGGPLDFGQGTVQKFVAKVNAAKQMPPADQPRPYFDGLTSDVTFDADDLRAKEYAIDGIHAELHSVGAQLDIRQLLVRRAENEIALNGRYELPADFAQAKQQPADVSFSLNLPHIGAFWIGDALVTGSLNGSGRIHYAQAQIGEGWFQFYGSKIAARRNLTIRELSAQGSTANNVVYLNDLTADLNANDYVRANGTFAVDQPYRYTGSLAVSIADLATLKPILETSGKDTELAGSLAINWSGDGEVVGFKNTGDLKLRLEHGRFANLEKLEANVDANYSPNELNIPIVYFASDKLMVQAIAQAKGSTLEITKIQLDQGQAKYAAGYVSVPFVWSNLGSDRPIIPADGKVLVSFQSENIDIAKLAKDLGQKAPVAGMANVKIDAQGTVEDLRATLDLQLTGLRSDQLKDFTPATFGLVARIENNKLFLDGKLQQARIEPVQITAEMPLPVARIVQEKHFDENTPIKAQVRMPRSSINFVRQFVPAIERIDGNLALDVNVGGTVAKPTFSGSADTTINVARLSNASVPPLSNFNARLVFNDDRLNFQQFGGELSGGKFTVTGAITFPSLTQPTFDLALKGDSMLVARNEDLTARADANIRVVGPLTSASVTGDIGITNSQFFKDIDLIPIGTPGRPPPAPKPPSDSPDLAFPNPPLRDWKFDLAVKTKDPFKIRGNLARGGAIIDMKISGTGEHPNIDGSVRLQNVEATLPFSRLEIQQGFIYFNPADPMNPGVDIQGTSLIRDYTVRVYVYGTANQPEAVFTSEPPLPQEDIISLLATGTTREELLSGNNVLAGRAVMLLGQQLYRKIFKKGQPTKENPIMENLQLDVGTVDPKTGQQTATARYRVNEKWQVLGEIGLQGDFRGQVRYLIRFH